MTGAAGSVAAHIVVDDAPHFEPRLLQLCLLVIDIDASQLVDDLLLILNDGFLLVLGEGVPGAGDVGFEAAHVSTSSITPPALR